MKRSRHADVQAVVLTPEPADDPADLEDVIHDEVRAAREPGAWVSHVRTVILDCSDLAGADLQRWLKAVGPEVPDANLRVVVPEKAAVVARMLGLTAFFEWYASVEEALQGGR